MKKLGLLIIPLMAASLLSSCGEGDNPGPKQWFNDDDYLSSLTEKDVTKYGGEIQTIVVNGVNHKVRLIGIDADVDENNNNIHTTWEFVNLISDENGYSLATYWNNTNSTGDANYDYRDSSIRKALTGEGKGSLNWFRYYGKDEDTAKTGKNRFFAKENNYKKSVLDMLPSNFKRVLKAVKKTVNVKNGSTWTPTDFIDKLFLLSPNELNEKKDYVEKGEAYEYYKNADPDFAPIRIKVQVKGTDGARTNYAYGSDLDGACTNTKYSYAGYNSAAETYGALSWLRSPHCRAGTDFAWFVGINGGLFGDSVYQYAYGVAPAFCI